LAAGIAHDLNNILDRHFRQHWPGPTGKRRVKKRICWFASLKQAIPAAQELPHVEVQFDSLSSKGGFPVKKLWNCPSCWLSQPFFATRRGIYAHEMDIPPDPVGRPKLIPTQIEQVNQCAE